MPRFPAAGITKLSELNIDADLAMGAHDITLGAAQTVDGVEVSDTIPGYDSIIGVEWNQGTDIWRRIREDGSEITAIPAGTSLAFFDSHSVWGNIRRCTLADDGSVNNYGSNGRGDGLTLDGTDGQVMVEIPKFWIKAANPSANVYQRWISPVAKTGFEVHPFFRQRGGGAGRDYAYYGAYEAYNDGGAPNKLMSMTGAVQAVSTTIGNFRTYAENRGSARWGITSIWALSAIQSLFYIEYAGADSQSLIGRGNVDTGGKVNTGADSTDTNIGTNGTGTGTGVDGATPIAYRGIENLWGNVYGFVDGYNCLADNSAYRLINRDGTGTFADALAATCEDSTAAPTQTDGYVKNIVYEDLLKYLMLSDGTAGGTAATYLYDQFYAHDVGELNILLSGGSWAYGDKAGVACLHSNDVATVVFTSVGARLEFV